MRFESLPQALRYHTHVSMKDRPLVSAIIATYNRGYVVDQAIESVLSQTYENVELIVVDDGSIDGTQEILRQYGDLLRVVYQKNAGPAAAWNRGIATSQGDIIAFLGSDGILAKSVKNLFRYFTFNRPSPGFRSNSGLREDRKRLHRHVLPST